MFWPDVIALKQFYASQVGDVACAVIRNAIRNFWPDAKNETLVGIGYATPYLEPYLGGAMSVVACMPAAQGGLYWPSHRDNLALLADEGKLPFKDGVMNRVILVHALENSEQARKMLQEVWRILTPGGRIMMVVPNRLGFWARSPYSPFGHGRPFSFWQLRKLLMDSRLAPLRSCHALFVPPRRFRFLLKFAFLIENIFSRLHAGFGGVIVMEAEKQVYASSRQPVQEKDVPTTYVTAQPAMSSISANSLQ